MSDAKSSVKYDIDPDSDEAITNFDDERRIEYILTKFTGTAQETCFNEVPVVKIGQV